MLARVKLPVEMRMWLACHTQEEIGEAVGCAKSVVNEICSEAAILPEANKPAAAHPGGAVTRPSPSPTAPQARPCC